MVDMVLDIRNDSHSFGKIILYDMPADNKADYSEWIWVLPGFAHGSFSPDDTAIECFCSGEYSPGCEAGISPLAKDIDWLLCDEKLKKLYDRIVPTTNLITDKDKNGFLVR
jgi:dTDP-4-dehydrorhamnose 3,5-epimerase-like enzyme